MFNITDALNNYKSKETNKNIEKSLNQRQAILKKFVDRLNQSRTQSGFKKLPDIVYIRKMYDSGLKSDYDLYWFYGYCNDAKNFSSCWWWSLKPAKIETI